MLVDDDLCPFKSCFLSRECPHISTFKLLLLGSLVFVYESQAVTAVNKECPTNATGDPIEGAPVISQAIVLAVFLLPMGLALIRGDKGSFLLTPVFNLLGELPDTDGRDMEGVLLLEYSAVGRV